MELFNERYINIVGKSSGEKPLSLGNSSYSNHHSIQKIKTLCVPENTFDLSYISTSETNKTIMLAKPKGQTMFPQNLLKYLQMLLIVI